MDFIINIFLGMIPEVLFFTLFLIYTKNIKEKQFKLFLLILVAYILCIMINECKVFYYVCFVFLVYIFLKILYKSKVQITDVFLLFGLEFYLYIISLLIYIPKNSYQYFICLIINRILLFLPFIFKNKFNILYKKYYKLWNRKYDRKQSIKSITLRTLSLLFVNFIIVLFDIILLYVINLIKIGVVI